MATDRLHGFEGRFQYVRCEDCGLVYMNPQISPECISQFYPADYAPHQVSSSAQNKITPKPDLPGMILDTLNPQSRVLDVGCGNGDFLHQLQKLCSCRVSGVDISENAASRAREQYGLEVFTGDILSAPLEDNTFDLVTARSCIEHIPDPATALKKAYALCKPSGRLFIKTPNSESFAAKFFKDKWYHLDCPRHLYIFSPSTIKALLERCGFEVVKVSYETSSKGWLGSLQYVFYGNNYQPRTKNKLRRSSLARLFVSPISHLSAWLKQADTMMVMARRKKS
jgi:ubiquinone/menaquinone biosynthesis C-methylase UbiE